MGTIGRPSSASSTIRLTIVIMLVLALIASSCSSGDDDDAAPPTPTPASSGGRGVSTIGSGTTSAAAAFAIRLSEAASGTSGSAANPLTVATGDPLQADEIAALFSRVPELEGDAGDEQDFNRPAESLPPPRTGETITTPFPAAGGDPVPDVDTGPLRVLRFQPDGAVAIAPTVTITFSQPMVPIATLGQLTAEDVPAILTPEVEGHWEWIGTRTLRFEHDSDTIDRLPMATAYTVEIPAGTTSATGGVLAEAETWGFETPPPQITDFKPEGEGKKLVPIFVVQFDQRVEPQALLDSITLRADGQDRAIRLATQAEIDADSVAPRRVARATEGRFIAFRATEPFEPGTDLEVTFAAGTPSAEGPLTTTEDQTFTARTYDPLRVVDQNCTGTHTCRPPTEFWFQFNNEIDADTFDPAAFTIDPEIPGVEIRLFGQGMAIFGDIAGRTDYEVTIPAELEDTWGQTLADDDRTLTFEVGAARPQLTPIHDGLVTTDPFSESPSLTVSSVNHDDLRVRIRRVDPREHWDTFILALEQQWEEGGVDLSDIPVTDSFTVSTDGTEDKRTQTDIDLGSSLDGDTGHLIVQVESTTEYSRNDDDYWSNRPILVWVQVTEIGVDAVIDADEIVAWATDLQSGAPIAGLDIEVLGSNSTGRTDSDGLSVLAAPPQTRPGWTLLAETDDDSAMTPGFYASGEGRSDTLRWHVLDDRSLYRPGETVSVKGWVRRLTTASDAQLAEIDDGARVTFTAHDAFGNEIADGETDVSGQGGFDFSFAIPAAANAGYSWVELRLTDAGSGIQNRQWGHSYQIEDFRRPEFEVTTEIDTAGPYLRTDPIIVTGAATYFSGGPLPDAEVDWRVWSTDASYSPPGWDQFTFGVWVPWWFEDGFGRGFEGDFPRFGEPGREPERFTGRTDGAGRHALQLDFDADTVDLPVTVTAQAAVTDVNRQTFSSDANLLVHPADVYVGLRSDRTFVRRGESLDIEAIVADIDGSAVPGRAVTVEAARLVWEYTDEGWERTEQDLQTCTETSGAVPVTCPFDTDKGGEYRIRAVVTDQVGRTNRSEMSRWVSGADRPPDRGLQLEAATLIPDQREYEPGDVAEILVDAPFEDGHGLLTIARNGVVETETFELDGTSAVVEIPIEDTYIPGVELLVEVVGAAERRADDGTPLPDAPERPAFATAQLRLDVPPVTRALTVEARPAATTLEPGDETSVEVFVTAADGTPVAGAELAVIVVDEAVLSLTNYTLRDPLDSFYAPIPADTFVRRGRSTIVLENPETLLAQGGAIPEPEPTEELAQSDALAAGDGGAEFGLDVASDDDSSLRTSAEAPAADLAQTDGGPPAGTVGVRRNFDALAVFEPEVLTNAQGEATVAVPLPDNLTRYRIIVLAADGADHFGAGEANITARLPLMVRPSAPRFLNFGDTFELPIVLQNQTDDDLEVDIGVQTANLTLTDGNGRRVTVPANDRIEVRFPAAAEEAGTARFQAIAVSGDLADAATISLPVYTPATAEAFATYGVVDDGGTVRQPVLAPTDVWPQFGGLEINTSSTALQALTDAVIYIHDYRYESSDGLASRILAVTALRDVLDAFDAEGLPEPAVLQSRIDQDIALLAARQNGNGGWGIWRLREESWPYHSIHVSHALVEADANGFAVPAQTLDNALRYLQNIENHIPSWYSERARTTITAYALHVRHRAGQSDPQGAEQLWNRTATEDNNTLTVEAMAWLWPVITDSGIDAEIERRFANSAVETAGAATFATDYGDDAYVILHSNRRTDGVILDALIAERPDSDLIPKVVTGLLGNQTRGRWNNMQENTFILLALNNYFDTFEAEDPDFVARVWLGDLYAAEHTYEGRSTDRSETLVPMAELIDQGDTDLVVDQDGAAGRLYYRLGVRYAPTDLDLDPLDRGFVVTRTYEAIDDPDDVRLDGDGVWHIVAGADVRVRITMVADSRRTHVALLDPLPAGLEPLNPNLDATPDISPDSDSDVSRRYRHWFNHQNLRDDRAEAFTSLLRAGTYEYTYVAGATTPGRFVTPPARAEEIFAPETFGRSGTDIVIVEE